MKSSVFVIVTASLVLTFSIVYYQHTRLLDEQFATLVVRNGTIYTADSSLPWADSFAVRKGRILGVGNYSSMQAFVGQDTEELDLEGKVVVPGFIDSHVHLILGGLEMMRVDLRGINQKDEFVKRVKEAVRNLKQGSWLLGGGWNNDLWGGELPKASWIDSLTPHNPVWLIRVDHHMGLANSLALRLTGISSSSKDVDGGSIVKSINGEPTGLLVDAAMNLIFGVIPKASEDDRREALSRASSYALSNGVTTIVDFGRYFQGQTVEHPWDDLADVYEWADSLDSMRIRACLFFPMESWSRLYDRFAKNGRAISDWIYLGGIKAFADGSLGSSSALFYESYVNEPHNHGLQVMDPEKLLDIILLADKSELQVAIHAIGDKANDRILDIYKSVISINGRRDRRFRIEHAQHLAPEAPSRFSKLGIVASMQPLHLLDDVDSSMKKLGVDRAEKGSYQFHSLLAENVQLAFGSDWPVADMCPLETIKVATKRIPPGWDKAWTPEQRISLNDSLTAHTISAASACFLDDVVGSLSLGKFADFVILSAKSLTEFEMDETVSVYATYVGGRRAFPL